MRNLIKRIKNAAVVGLSILTMVGAASPAASPLITVNAESTDILSTVNDLAGETVAANDTETTWHNLSTYAVNTSLSWNDLANMDAATMRANGFDCARSSAWIITHYLAAQGTPLSAFGFDMSTRMFMGSNLASVLDAAVTASANNTTTKLTMHTETTADGRPDTTNLAPGAILLYGTGSVGHMAVYLGNGLMWNYGSPGRYQIVPVKAQASSGGSKMYNFWRAYSGPTDKDVSITVTKTSSNEGVTNGNAMYSLAGAEFSVYDSSDMTSLLGTMTTDASGKASATFTVSGSLNTLYVKETKAPANYKISDHELKSVDVSTGSGTLTFADEPVTDPGRISITKIDKEGKAKTAAMDAAEFTIKYYDTTGDISGREATRTWVVATKYNNTYQGYMAWLDAEHVVNIKSDVLYTDTAGKTVIPVGTVTIQETKAADKYTVEGGYIKTTDGTTLSSEDILEYKIVDEDDSPRVYVGNQMTDEAYTKEEVPVRGGFSIKKVDYDTSSNSQGDASFAGAEFDLFYLGNGTDDSTMMLDTDGDRIGDGTEYEPSETEAIAHVTTGADGTYTSSFKYLAIGNYRLVETKAPEGYSNYDRKGNVVTLDFSITSDGEFKTITVPDVLRTVNVQLYKHHDTSDSKFGDNTSSEVDDRPEANAEFAILLKSKVDSDYNGDVDAAVEALRSGTSTFTSHEAKIAKTNDKGIAKMNELAIGTYLLKQTGGDAKTELLKDAYTFEISESDLDSDPKVINTTDAVQLSITNNDKPFIIEFTKKDSYTGSNVILNSAAFQIMDKSTGKLVEMEVGSKTYNTFRTVSANSLSTKTAGYYMIPDAEENEYGKAITPLVLRSGEYTITEVETPAGFVTADPFDITVNSEADIVRVTANNNYVQGVDVKNQPALGQLTINKKAELVEGADINLLNEDLDLSGVKYELRAVEDIINPDDGSVLIQKGEIAVDLNKAEIGSFNLDKDGKAIIENIPLGKYTLAEVQTVPGLALNTESHDVEFLYKDEKTAVIPVSVDVTNYETDTKFSKVDITGDNELPGAHLVIRDADGNVVTEWDSKETPTEIAGIPEGTYTLEETIAPKDYVRSTTAVEFTVKGHEVSQVKMVDKQLTFEKLEMCGDRVDGAQVTVYELDADGNHVQTAVLDENGEPVLNEDGTQQMADKVVDQFTTASDKDVLVNNLEEGKTYAAVETVVPEGFVKMADKVFTVEGVDENGEKTNQKVSVVEKQVEVSKEDAGGKEVAGAKLQIIDEDGNVIDEWTSGSEPHYVSGLEVGKTYTLHEDTAPLGYVKATDITFTVTDNGVDQKVTMIDTIEKFAKYDDEGNLLKGAELEAVDANGKVIDTWTSGEHIADLTDEEVETLKGGKEVTVTAEEGAAIRIVPLYKSDDSDSDGDESGTTGAITDETCEYKTARSAYWAGADETSDDRGITGYEAVITDASGNISYKMIDLEGDEAEHMISGLTANGVYTIKEVKAVDGYYYDNDVEIIPDGVTDGNPSMTDALVKYKIAKVDENGAPVEGVTLKLTDVTVDENGAYINTDEDGNPAVIELPNDGVTTKEPFELDGVLLAEHNYRLEESEWVGGVYKATDVYFNVSRYGDAENPVITVTMVDELANVVVKKVDGSGNPVKGAKLQILEAEPATGKAAASETSKTAEAEQTDEDQTDAVEETVNEDPNAKNVEYVPAADENGDPIVVYEFESTDSKDGVDISKYVKGGKTYILREVEAPFGYNTIKDTVFTVVGTSASYQVMYAVDTAKNFEVDIVKTNTDKTKKLEGAEFALFNAKTNKIVRDVNGNAARGKTDSNGSLKFTVAYNDSGDGWYLMELAAPKGYVLSQTHYKVELGKDYTFETPLVYRITNQENPSNGVAAPIAGMIGGGAAGAVLIAVLLEEKKKHKSVKA